MKWLVTWVVINTFLVPCNNGPSEPYDEYGQKNYNYNTIAMACWDHEVGDMTRFFDSYKEAKAFVDEGKNRCQGAFECDLRDFKISRVEEVK